MCSNTGMHVCVKCMCTYNISDTMNPMNQFAKAFNHEFPHIWTWMQDARPGKLTLGVKSHVESDVQVRIFNSHLEPQNYEKSNQWTVWFLLVSYNPMNGLVKDNQKLIILIFRPRRTMLNLRTWLCGWKNHKDNCSDPKCSNPASEPAKERRNNSCGICWLIWYVSLLVFLLIRSWKLRP